ncbi:hypothetical protein [Endozoicomonas sp. SCSIO W0465]|uniref:hypothetical protein n=1 Tax=Endozoicomonas sp. SCSIO W0465 TaxID=2918516 RepID=UPI0020764786|nr:hypothetical protein [Endozoicomonas sp. SCSIO W0465]USE38765.1 hypothetical protein MJO57_11665 [Endozoicomonas sp. SCSIO W0465]
MLANIVEKWCLRGWYKNQKIPDLCGGAEQLQSNHGRSSKSLPASLNTFHLSRTKQLTISIVLCATIQYYNRVKVSY